MNALSVARKVQSWRSICSWPDWVASTPATMEDKGPQDDSTSAPLQQLDIKAPSSFFCAMVVGQSSCDPTRLLQHDTGSRNFALKD
jgi:hypothetical protein